MIKQWEINYRDDGVMKQFSVKKMDYRQAYQAARELFPTCEIVLIIELGVVIE